MNERIKELAEQAGFEFDAECVEGWIAEDEHIERFAELVRQDERERMNGIALTNIPHPEGNPVPDDVKLNPDSLETIEIDIPVMPKDQLETWMHNMIRSCNRSTSDSDINVIKLIQHIENLYMQGRADEREQISHTYLKLTMEAVLREREANAKLCDDLLDGKDRGRGYWSDGVRDAQDAIRQRGEK